MTTPWGLHWFRRDLRVAGNPALNWSLEEHKGRVLGLFCFDKAFLARPDLSIDRFQFFIETLVDLEAELRELGSGLLVLDTGPADAFPKLFAALASHGAKRPQAVTWNRDYEPFAKARDERMQTWLQGQGVATHTERDHLIIEPEEITTGEGKGFQVYGPFAKKWLDRLQTPEFQERITAQRSGLKDLAGRGRRSGEPAFLLNWSQLFGGKTPLPSVLEHYRAENGRKLSVPLPAVGGRAALARLNKFAKELAAYGEQRDLPGVDGTSHMSLYFKNGAITTSQVIQHLGLHQPEQQTGGALKYLKELVWREFYYHILDRHPRVEQEAYLVRYNDMVWENDEALFQAWKDGLTGFPLVDAGMRQLRQTGWMHNRVRMVVASFLTKDLLIDWRWGERYFMERLLDGDLAPNNGGWQWAASTGCDPQPYFRIFNPVLQSRRFDPTGSYIKTYVPELRHLSGKQIHDPADDQRRSYPPRIIEHHVQRNRALKLYKKIQPLR